MFGVIDLGLVDCTACGGHSWMLPPRNEEELKAIKCGFCDLPLSEMEPPEPEHQEVKVEEVQPEQVEEQIETEAVEEKGKEDGKDSDTACSVAG